MHRGICVLEITSFYIGYYPKEALIFDSKGRRAAQTWFDSLRKELDVAYSLTGPNCSQFV